MHRDEKTPSSDRVNFHVEVSSHPPVVLHMEVPNREDDGAESVRRDATAVQRMLTALTEACRGRENVVPGILD